MQGTALIQSSVFPHHADYIPPGTIDAGPYRLQFAWTRADLIQVQSLRFRVLTEALGAPFSVSTTSDVDDDIRDGWFHHLMIYHQDTNTVVGTYRVQTAVMAASRFGFYSASLFELAAIPGAVLDSAVEIGRACVDPAHRNGRVLRLLWRGLARYLQWNSKRYFFGCCSMPGTDPEAAATTWRILHARRLMHDRILLRPHANGNLLADEGRARPLIDAASLEGVLPPLFEGYMSLGARVCGAPAIDHAFGTTDFFVLLDVEAMDERVRRSFFA